MAFRIIEEASIGGGLNLTIKVINPEHILLRWHVTKLA